jgi:hypothetical protein
VHDFSRLNSQGLLDSTIDAVGENRLKAVLRIRDPVLFCPRDPGLKI